VAKRSVVQRLGLSKPKLIIRERVKTTAVTKTPRLWNDFSSIGVTSALALLFLAEIFPPLFIIAMLLMCVSGILGAYQSIKRLIILHENKKRFDENHDAIELNELQQHERHQIVQNQWRHTIKLSFEFLSIAIAGATATYGIILFKTSALTLGFLTSSLMAISGLSTLVTAAVMIWNFVKYRQANKEYELYKTLNPNSTLNNNIKLAELHAHKEDRYAKLRLTTLIFAGTALCLCLSFLTFSWPVIAVGVVISIATAAVMCYYLYKNYRNLQLNNKMEAANDILTRQGVNTNSLKEKRDAVDKAIMKLKSGNTHPNGERVLKRWQFIEEFKEYKQHTAALENAVDALNQEMNAQLVQHAQHLIVQINAGTIAIANTTYLNHANKRVGEIRGHLFTLNIIAGALSTWNIPERLSTAFKIARLEKEYASVHADQQFLVSAKQTVEYTTAAITSKKQEITAYTGWNPFKHLQLKRELSRLENQLQTAIEDLTLDINEVTTQVGDQMIYSKTPSPSKTSSPLPPSTPVNDQGHDPHAKQNLRGTYPPANSHASKPTSSLHLLSQNGGNFVSPAPQPSETPANTGTMPASTSKIPSLRGGRASSD